VPAQDSLREILRRALRNRVGGEEYAGQPTIDDLTIFNKIAE